MALEKEKGHTVLEHDAPKQFLYCPDKSHSDSITNFGDCQGFTEKNEIEVKFAPKRKQSELLAESFYRLELEKRAQRVSECGTFLEFAHQMDGYGNVSEQGKLHNANFCRDRLCPMCSWRRSYKVFAQVSQIMNVIKNQYAFLFLTLTVPNVSADKLSEKLSELQKGWQKLRRQKKFKTAVKGFFKALEITYNVRSDTYHPHYHIVLAVLPSYFTSRDYIAQAEWLSMWQDSMGDDSITQVDIRRAKNKYSNAELEASDSLASAIAEIAKYAVKFDDDMLKNDSVIGTLATVLHGKRLCEFDGKGAFGLARAQLMLDDPEDGDLIHVEDDKIEPSLALLIVRYGWSAGAYQMLDSFVKECV